MRVGSSVQQNSLSVSPVLDTGSVPDGAQSKSTQKGKFKQLGMIQSSVGPQKPTKAHVESVEETPQTSGDPYEHILVLYLQNIPPLPDCIRAVHNDVISLRNESRSKDVLLLWRFLKSVRPGYALSLQMAQDAVVLFGQHLKSLYMELPVTMIHFLWAYVERLVGCFLDGGGIVDFQWQLFIGSGLIGGLELALHSADTADHVFGTIATARLCQLLSKSTDPTSKLSRGFTEAILKILAKGISPAHLTNNPSAIVSDGIAHLKFTFICQDTTESSTIDIKFPAISLEVFWNLLDLPEPSVLSSAMQTPGAQPEDAQFDRPELPSKRLMSPPRAENWDEDLYG